MNFGFQKIIVPIRRFIMPQNIIRTSKFPNGWCNDEKNGNGETPCDYAITYNPSVEVVRFFSEQSPDAPISRLCRALQHSQKPEVLRFLAGQVPDINAWYQGRPPLHDAKDVASAKILLECGADIHAKNEWGYTIFDVLDEELSRGELYNFLKHWDEKNPTE
jgi:ankyrin repeat protein